MRKGAYPVSADHPQSSVELNSNCFDLIRYACTFTVFLGHYLTHFGIENNLLHEVAYFVRGVPVFFFLSGLFIARSLERYNTKDYLTKRAMRIFPELWVCVLINLGLILLSLKRVTMKDLIVYLATQLTAFQFYTGDWLRAYGTGTPNGALWTITVDLQFYLVAIVVAKALRGRSWRTWLHAILALMLVDFGLEMARGIYPATVYKLLMVSLLPFLWIFLSGMATYYFKDVLVPAAVKYRLPVVITYVVWQLFVPKEVTGVFQGVRYNLVTTSLLIMALAAIGFSWKRRTRSDYSYSFYLYHMVVMNFVIERWRVHLTGFSSCAVMLVVLCCITTAFALLSHDLIAVRLTTALEKQLSKPGASC